MSLGDTLDREPKHICDPNPKELIHRFMEELERSRRRIRAAVWATFMPEGVEMLLKRCRKAIKEWCDQVLVLGFNRGRYDLNLIKEHFVETLADTTDKVQVGKKANTTLFMKTSGLRFVDIINYLAPGTSHDKWVKAYGCSF